MERGTRASAMGPRAGAQHETLTFAYLRLRPSAPHISGSGVFEFDIGRRRTHVLRHGPSHPFRLIGQGSRPMTRVATRSPMLRARRAKFLSGEVVPCFARSTAIAALAIGLSATALMYPPTHAASGASMVEEVSMVVEASMAGSAASRGGGFAFHRGLTVSTKASSDSASPTATASVIASSIAIASGTGSSAAGSERRLHRVRRRLHLCERLSLHDDYYDSGYYGYSCYLQRQPLWNGYRYVNQLVRVCQ